MAVCFVVPPQLALHQCPPQMISPPFFGMNVSELHHFAQPGGLLAELSGRTSLLSHANPHPSLLYSERNAFFFSQSLEEPWTKPCTQTHSLATVCLHHVACCSLWTLLGMTVSSSPDFSPIFFSRAEGT